MTSNETNRAPMAGDRIRYRRKQDAFITNLRNGEVVKLLEGDARLEAALFIGRLYGRLRHTQSSRQIREALADLDRGGEPFRIHRWMIQGTDEGLTDTIRHKYRAHPEPQKKVATYILLVERLALLLGDDAFALIWELLEVTCLTARMHRLPSIEIMGDVEPRQRLAALLNAHAAHMSEMLDLPQLWQAAENLQMGWDMEEGPSPVPLNGGIMQNHFRHDAPATQVQWLDFEAPAYPSVQTARLPNGVLAGPFVVTRSAPSTKEAEIIAANLVIYWDLWLTIAPLGKLGVGAFLVRTPGTALQLNDGTLVHLATPKAGYWDMTFVPKTLELQHAKLDGDLSPTGSGVGWHDVLNVTFSQDRLDEIQKDIALYDKFFRKPRPHVPDDEDGEEMPFLRMVRVTPQSIADWLEADFTFQRPGFFADPVHFVSSRQPSAERYGWMRGDTLARRVEQALHDGLLDAWFRDWVTAYGAALSGIEADWRARAEEAELELRDRWQAERLDRPEGQ